MAGDTSCVKMRVADEESCECRNCNVTRPPPALPDITKFNFTKCISNWTYEPLIPHCAPCPPNETTTQITATLVTTTTPVSVDRTTATLSPDKTTATLSPDKTAAQTTAAALVTATGAAQTTTAALLTTVNTTTGCDDGCGGLNTNDCLLFLPLLLIIPAVAIAFACWQYRKKLKAFSYAVSDGDTPSLSAEIYSDKSKSGENDSKPRSASTDTDLPALSNPAYDDDTAENTATVVLDAVDALMSNEDKTSRSGSIAEEAIKHVFDVDQNSQPPGEKTRDAKRGERLSENVGSVKVDMAEETPL